MHDPERYFDSLNLQYSQIHKVKEDLFWTTYMGVSDDHEGFARAETKLMEFISDTRRLHEIRDLLQNLQSMAEFPRKSDIEVGLKGWLSLFETHAIDSHEALELKKDLIQCEKKLFDSYQKHTMTYCDEQGTMKKGSLPVFSANIMANNNERVRKSSHEALLQLEQWVLENGFIELVKKRNQFARKRGYANYFDYSIEKCERMTTTELFEILDDFEQRTRKKNRASIQSLQSEFGEQALTGYNFNYTWEGNSIQDLDSFVPFSQSLRHWIESFGKLHIDYQGAELTLDLLDRKGKYQNGFCHSPILSYFNKGQWIPAKINFTSNAKPGQIGSGFMAINTMFHEGGHAAHFANVMMNSPCFSLEYAPSSMAFAETQSMFCNSLLSDGDWLKKYAKDAMGNEIPNAKIKDLLEKTHPFRTYQERGILVVPYFERALYSLNESQLIPSKITALAREMEYKFLGLKISPWPLLAIPHLLSGDSACTFQGYLLAHMAVYQSRAFLLDSCGYLTDNAKIGPLLAKHYWHPGNSISHDQAIKNLTGEGFNPKYLADICNQSVEEAWNLELKKITMIPSQEESEKMSLNAQISVVDGDTILATNSESDEILCQQFEDYIENLSKGTQG